MEGKLNLVADALSRSPIFAAEKDDPDLFCTVRAAKLDESGQMNNCTPDLALNEIIEVAEADTDYQLNYKALVQHKQLGNLPRDHPAQKLSSIWDVLSIEDELPNLILYHGRIYVPQGAVELVMKKLHIQHTAFDKTLQNARSMYFWLGMKITLS